MSEFCLHEINTIIKKKDSLWLGGEKQSWNSCATVRASLQWRRILNPNLNATPSTGLEHNNNNNNNNNIHIKQIGHGEKNNQIKFLYELENAEMAFYTYSLKSSMDQNRGKKPTECNWNY